MVTLHRHASLSKTSSTYVNAHAHAHVNFGFYLDIHGMLCTWFFMVLIGSSGRKDAQLAFWSLRGLSTTLYREVRCKPNGCIAMMCPSILV